MNKMPIEQRIVFGVSPRDDGADLLIGMPAGAWEYCKDGKTHTLDLSAIGIPIRLLIYGAENHDAAIKVVEEHNKSLGIATLDERRRDFSIKSDITHTFPKERR